MTADPYVRFVGVQKAYGSHLAVAGLDLDIARGEFFSLLGPSGCGKTTTLRVLAGFIRPSAGRIEVGGNDITALPPERRNVGVVFQDYAIFPHLSVYDNVAFGLKMRKQSRPEIDGKVRSALAQVGLADSADKHRKQLSGGQQQRVALARALVTEPDVLLLDEPLSALDLKLREQMRYWIRDLQRKLGITTIYVTHDQAEALTMSDRMAVMREGRVLQVGAPDEVYERPSDIFVASFLGQSVLLPAVVVGGGPDATMVDCAGQAIGPVRSPVRTPGAQVTLLLRPEQIDLYESGTDAVAAGRCLHGTVRASSYEGSVIRYQVCLNGSDVTVTAERPNRVGARTFGPGDQVTAAWSPDAVVVFAGATAAAGVTTEPVAAEVRG